MLLCVKSTTVFIWEFALNANCLYSWKANGGTPSRQELCSVSELWAKGKEEGGNFESPVLYDGWLPGVEHDQLWSRGTKAACSAAQSTRRKRLREQKYLWLCSASKKLGATLSSQSYVVYQSEYLWCSHGSPRMKPDTCCDPRHFLFFIQSRSGPSLSQIFGM